MKCCIYCFNDMNLAMLIHDLGEIGNCDYCEKKDNKILDVSELTSEFNKLMKYYKVTEPYVDYIPEIHDDPSEFGDRLINIINEDWDLFSEKLEGSGIDEKLLLGSDHIAIKLKFCCTPRTKFWTFL